MIELGNTSARFEFGHNELVCARLIWSESVCRLEDHFRPGGACKANTAWTQRARDGLCQAAEVAEVPRALVRLVAQNMLRAA